MIMASCCCCSSVICCCCCCFLSSCCSPWGMKRGKDSSSSLFLFWFGFLVWVWMHYLCLYFDTYVRARAKVWADHTVVVVGCVCVFLFLFLLERKRRRRRRRIWVGAGGRGLGFMSFWRRRVAAVCGSRSRRALWNLRLPQDTRKRFWWSWLVGVVVVEAFFLQRRLPRLSANSVCIGCSGTRTCWVFFLTRKMCLYHH